MEHCLKVSRPNHFDTSIVTKVNSTRQYFSGVVSAGHDRRLFRLISVGNSYPKFVYRNHAPIPSEERREIAGYDIRYFVPDRFHVERLIYPCYFAVVFDSNEDVAEKTSFMAAGEITRPGRMKNDIM
jgi:hypothetical protein